MKFRWDKKYLYWGLTAFLVIAFSVAFFFALFRFDVLSKGLETIVGILMPVLYGVAFAYLLSPAVNFFDRHLISLFERKGKRWTAPKRKKAARIVSVVITMLLAVFVVAALISMVIPQLTTSIATFVENVPRYLANIQTKVSSLFPENTDMKAWVEGLLMNLSSNYDQIYDRVREFLPSVNNILAGVTIGVMGVFNVIKNVGIGAIVSIYLLYSKETFSAQCKKILYALFETKHANAVVDTARETHHMFSNFIIGKLLDSLIIGIICFICMSLFGMPLPLLISVIIGVTNIVPFFGPFIGAIPSSLIILLVEPQTCIYFILFVLVLQQFDGNILGPKILGESTGLSSFWVIFAILVGGGLFGFIGMIVGVPFFAVIYVFIRRFMEKMLKAKGLPDKTSEYRDLKTINAADKTIEMFAEGEKR